MARSSRSQPQPSQSQPRRTQRRRAEEEDDDDVENPPRHQERDEEEMEQDDDDENAAGGDLETRANNLVRLALFTEQRRVPLRREEISKKVLGSQTRQFNAVLERAQQILRKTFGMELVELRSRAAANAEAAGEHAGDIEGTGIKKKAAAQGSKTYILRSTLHPAIIEAAAAPDEKILEEEAALEEDNEDEEEGRPRNYGGVIAWGSADQLGAAGILHVVLALVLVSGRVMSDMDLQAQLKRLRLSANAGDVVYVTALATHRETPADKFLDQLIRQGYLDRQKVGDGGAKGKGGKRGRGAASQGDDGASTAYEWRWGPRAHAEIGEDALAQFVAEFMVERSGSAEDADRRRQAETEKKVGQMMKGIERAAGGALSEVK